MNRQELTASGSLPGSVTAAACITLAVAVLIAPSPGAAQDHELTATVHTLLGPDAAFTDGISLAADGSLFASDALGPGSLNDPQGTIISRIAPDLTVTTHAVGLNVPMDNVLDEEGNLYVTNWFGLVNKILPDGTVTVYANSTYCSGIARDSQGNIYVSRPSGVPQYNQIRKITPQGGNSIYYSGTPLNVSIGLAIDEEDNLYVANFQDGKIHRIPASNPSVAELIAQVPDPVSGCIGFMAYRDGRLYVPGYHKCRVYMVEVDTGELSVLAGTGVPGRVDGPAETAQFYQPNGVEVSVTGDTLYITDDVDRTLRIIVMDEGPTGIADPAEENGAQSTAPGFVLQLVNRPNPFRQSTSISFELPRAAAIELRVYNVNGHLIRTLARGLRPAGRQVIGWDGTDESGRQVGAGIYFYDLTGAGIDAGRNTRKMLLMR